MTPTLGGTIDPSFFSQYDTTVQQGLATGAYVILDLVTLVSPVRYLDISRHISAQLRSLEWWDYQSRRADHCSIRKSLVPARCEVR